MATPGYLAIVKFGGTAACSYDPFSPVTVGYAATRRSATANGSELIVFSDYAEHVLAEPEQRPSRIFALRDYDK